MMPNFQLNENWGALFLVQVWDLMIIGRIQGENQPKNWTDFHSILNNRAQHNL